METISGNCASTALIGWSPSRLFLVYTTKTRALSYLGIDAVVGASTDSPTNQTVSFFHAIGCNRDSRPNNSSTVSE
jgi:hypothetical protein